MSCWYCLSLDVRAVQQIPGWRLIGRNPIGKKGRTSGRSGVPTPSRREQVYARDGFRCVRCGDDNRATLTLDHIRPKSKGGDNSLENLQTLCRPCNTLKADHLPSPGATWPAEIAA
jgi:5-methylcytosine-specific restriction endonuclease McrA